MSNIDSYRNLFVGVDDKLKNSDGSLFVPINFDNAATTPAFKYVHDNVEEYSHCYGSIGRGKGLKSCMCTDFYENSRKVVLNFFDIPDDKDYTVIYVKNTTEAINVLAQALIDDKSEKIISTRMEHHANDLPWREQADVLYIDVDENGRLNLSDIEKVLKNNKIKLVTITAASNVTGYINPVNKIAKIAHKYGAMIVVDAAQLVAHKHLNILGENEGEDIDFVAFSAHKMYAPFGAGAIIAKRSLIKDKVPFIKGGGAVDMVLDNKVYWEKIPARYEAGTPNFLGVVALVSAIQELNKISFSNLEKHEVYLKKYLLDRLNLIPNIIEYGQPRDNDSIGVVSINIEGREHEEVAKLLSDIRGIAVRSGGFCSHPYVRRLIGYDEKESMKYIADPSISRPGLVRISFGLYNNESEVDIFLDTLEYIAKNKNLRI